MAVSLRARPEANMNTTGDSILEEHQAVSKKWPIDEGQLWKHMVAHDLR